MRVLVVNSGSSSVKLTLLDGDETVKQDSVDPADAHDAIAALVTERPDAVGHRIVHGGTRFTGPTVVDDDVVDGIAALTSLAPLHQGPALEALRQARAALPDVPQVACFDTAFHRTLPPAAHTYAVPARWREEYGVRRYGFHGLAHQWASGRAAELVGRPVGELRTVVAHLGSGASLCAVDRGLSVDTTMGHTPTAGLVMGSRSGDLDPAVPTYLVGRGEDASAVDTTLNKESGLRGLAGTSDMREVVSRTDADAVLAVDVWVHRARALVASMVAALGGIDVLAFSGGVGEHQPLLRARIVDGLGFLGLRLDTGRNEAATDGDAVIGDSATTAATVVVQAREDLVIAAEVRDVLGRTTDSTV
jgi:acetate kinase